MDTEPLVEIPVNSELPVEIPPDERAGSRFPAQLPSVEPHCTAVSRNVDSPTPELMDTDDKNFEAELPVGSSVDVNTGSPSVDIAVVNEGPVVNSRLSDDKNGCSIVEEDQDINDGLLTCYFISSFC